MRAYKRDSSLPVLTSSPHSRRKERTPRLHLQHSKSSCRTTTSATILLENSQWPLKNPSTAVVGKNNGGRLGNTRRISCRKSFPSPPISSSSSLAHIPTAQQRRQQGSTPRRVARRRPSLETIMETRYRTPNIVTPPSTNVDVFGQSILSVNVWDDHESFP